MEIDSKGPAKMKLGVLPVRFSETVLWILLIFWYFGKNLG